MEDFKLGIDLEKLPIVLYDSECSLCERFKQSVERFDKSKFINFVNIYNEEIYKLYPSLDKEKCLKEMHLIISKDKIISGKESLEYMIANIPEVEKFAWLIENKMGQKAIEIFHDTANLLRRKLLNKCPSCNHK